MKFDKQAVEVAADAKAHAAAVVAAFRDGSGKLWTVRAILAELESAYIAGYSNGMRDLTRATDTVQWPAAQPSRMHQNCGSCRCPDPDAPARVRP